MNPRSTLLLAPLFLSLAAAWAQTSPASDDLFFETIDVRLTNLEVLVTDRDGKPVHGLETSDFQLLEDGQEVEITHFSAVEDRRSRRMDEGDDVVQEMLPSTRHLNLVVYVDDFNLDPKNRNRTLRSLRTFLEEELDARDRVMLVRFDGNLRVVQPFTDDAQAALAALEGMETASSRHVEVLAGRRRVLRQVQTAPVSPRPGPNALNQADFEAAVQTAEGLIRDVEHQIQFESERVQVTLEGLEQFVTSLAGLPGRKAFLYVSDGLPERVGEALVQAYENKFAFWAQNNQVNSVQRELLRLRNATRPFGSDFKKLGEQAAAQRVAFYPISAGVPSGGRVGSAEIMGSDTPTGAGAYSADVAVTELFNRETPLLTLAAETGGVTYSRSTNLAGLLDQVVEDFSTFYSLGYTPPNAGDGEYHAVEVKIRGRDDLRVRHGGGVKETEPLEELRSLTLSALHYEFQENPLDVEVVLGQHRETAGGGYRVPLLLKIPFKNLALLPKDGVFEGRVVAYVIVQDDKGGTSPFQRIVLPIQIPEAQFEEALESEAGYQIDLAMRRGHHRVSVGVRDLVTNLQATINREVVVGRGGR